MTVSYTDFVATANPLTFVKLLFRWRGSVYKLLYKDLLVYLAIYYVLTAVYIFGLNEHQKKAYEKFVKKTEKYTSAVPLSFVLGFFVANVMTRWWNQYQGIPWPTAAAVYISSTLHGYDEVGRAMRRTCMRYLCLSLTMVLRVLSPRVKKRFPKLKDLIEAGLLNENEYNIIEALETKFPGYSKNWLPIVWAASIITRARKEGRIHDDFATKTIIQELNAFRGKCGVLMSYNSISIPLVYTQVVSIATYTYFMIALISNQYVEPVESNSVGVKIMDLIPILTILKFVFYMGWLKVAEALMNPFGEDDDDFEVNSIIDQNLQMSYLIVDEMHNDHPELLKDQYWNEIPTKLPDRAENEEDEKRRNSFNEADIVDFNIIQRSSIFGNDVIKLIASSNEKERKESKDKQTLVQMDSEEGILIDPTISTSPALVSIAPSLITLAPPVASVAPPENLKPDANIISHVYKKIENVEEEQNKIKEAIELRKRRKTIEIRALESNDEEEFKSFGGPAENDGMEKKE